ncbi:MAG: alanine--tRNA ligase, partial [Alphaproteobacteria bacterium]|nr:alanine--tRNA ligase [Alphaproteobacteria bacterium]MBX9976763.1 alanine--tRNA ligase [Alphaproteobacteria bacterium]
DLREKALAGDTGAATSKSINGVNFLFKDAGDAPANELKSLVDQFKVQIKSGVVVASSGNDEKISIVIGVTPDLTEKFNAITFAKKASEILGGKGGGGRPDLAQAGGTSKKNINKVLEEIEKSIELGI